MYLPFTTQQFLDVFKKYNVSVFPMQLLIYASALFVAYLLFWGRRFGRQSILYIIATWWLWMGIVYHILFFSEINNAAYGFGALFIAEAFTLLYVASRKEFSFEYYHNNSSIAGALLIIYSLVLYPVLGFVAGRSYPYSPTFVLPCPTTIFTLGVFLLSNKALPWFITIVPVIWSIIGFSAAFSLGIYEDTGLLVSAIVFLVLNSKKRRKERGAAIPL